MDSGTFGVFLGKLKTKRRWRRRWWWWLAVSHSKALITRKLENKKITFTPPLGIRSVFSVEPLRSDTSDPTFIFFLLFPSASFRPSFLSLSLLLLFGCQVSNWRRWRRCAQLRSQIGGIMKWKGRKRDAAGEWKTAGFVFFFLFFLFSYLFFSLLMGCFDKAAVRAAHWFVCHCDAVGAEGSVPPSPPLHRKWASLLLLTIQMRVRRNKSRS